jgi:hypothetical protein
VAGACAPACAYEGGDCLVDDDCCGVLLCGPGGTCGTAATTPDPDAGGAPLCGVPDEPCEDNRDCCSDACSYYTSTCY